MCSSIADHFAVLAHKYLQIPALILPLVMLSDKMHTRNMLISQSAAFNSLSILPEAEEIPPPSVSVLPDSNVALKNLSSSSSISSPTAMLQDQPSSAFPAAVTNAVKQLLLAEQATSAPATSALMS